MRAAAALLLLCCCVFGRASSSSLSHEVATEAVKLARTIRPLTELTGDTPPDPAPDGEAREEEDGGDDEGNITSKLPPFRPYTVPKAPRPTSWVRCRALTSNLPSSI
jgi:hypothetical protein